MLLGELDLLHLLRSGRAGNKQNGNQKRREPHTQKRPTRGHRVSDANERHGMVLHLDTASLSIALIAHMVSWCAIIHGLRPRLPVTRRHKRRPTRSSSIESVSVRDSASVQAVTRVNAEQASKRTMRGPPDAADAALGIYRHAISGRHRATLWLAHSRSRWPRTIRIRQDASVTTAK